MLRVALLVVLGCSTLAYGFSLNNLPEHGSDDSDVAELSHEEGHDCTCTHRICYCSAMNMHSHVAAAFMVDQIRLCKHKGCRKTLISGVFYVNDTQFERRFFANQFEEFCQSVDEERFCFRIDVNSYQWKSRMRGCLMMTRPKVIDLGCFNMPLLTSQNDVDADVTVIDNNENEDSVDEWQTQDELRFETL